MANDYTRKSRYPASPFYTPPGYQSPSAARRTYYPASPNYTPPGSPGYVPPTTVPSVQPPAPMQLSAPSSSRPAPMQLSAPANSRPQLSALPQPTVPPASQQPTAPPALRFGSVRPLPVATLPEGLPDPEDFRSSPLAPFKTTPLATPRVFGQGFIRSSLPAPADEMKMRKAALRKMSKAAFSDEDEKTVPDPENLPSQRDPLKRDPMVAGQNIFEDPAKEAQFRGIMSQNNKINRESAELGSTADTLRARREGRPARATNIAPEDPRMAVGPPTRADATLEQMAVDRRQGDAAGARARARFQAVQDGYANMAGGNSSLYDSSAVGNQSRIMAPPSAADSFNSRLMNMSPEERKQEAFTSTQSGLKGRGSYGGRGNYSAEGSLAGRENALDAAGGLAPTTQMIADQRNANADARRRAGNKMAGRSGEDMGSRYGSGVRRDESGSAKVQTDGDYGDYVTNREGERIYQRGMGIGATVMTPGATNADGEPLAPRTMSNYARIRANMTDERRKLNDEFQDRRRARRERAQDIMTMRAQMANTTTGRQAFGMGGNGFSPQMQYATTYQYNRPSPGQAAAMLDESRRRQQVADRADEQQAFNNQLAVVTAMPEGPQRTQALNQLQAMMQPSSGEVADSQQDLTTPPTAESVSNQSEFLAGTQTQEGAQSAYERISPMLGYMEDEELGVFLRETGVSPARMIALLDQQIIPDYDPDAVMNRIEEKRRNYNGSQGVSSQRADDSAYQLAVKQKELRQHRSRLETYQNRGR